MKAQDSILELKMALPCSGHAVPYRLGGSMHEADTMSPEPTTFGFRPG